MPSLSLALRAPATALKVSLAAVSVSVMVVGVVITGEVLLALLAEK